MNIRLPRAGNLLDDETLRKSSIVANCAMNRQRQLVGSNGYAFELKFDIASWLSTQLEVRPIRWLDVCCGTGMALIDAVQLSETLGHSNQLSIVGIDLAGHFCWPQLSAARAEENFDRVLGSSRWIRLSDLRTRITLHR